MQQDEKKPSQRMAYRIAVALQTKLKDKTLWLRTQRFETTGRILFEYVLSEGGRIEVSAAFSEGFFENEDKAHVSWLATQIYRQLNDQLRWQLQGNSHASAPHARVTDEETGFRKVAVAPTRVPKDRRNKSGNGGRKATVKKAATDSQPSYTESIPAGIT